MQTVLVARTAYR
uniref:Uncharacterized protein n=1 Tax=Arundo donax TaxID=35708 RepID=A0A0A8ZZM6_ARUDO